MNITKMIESGKKKPFWLFLFTLVFLSLFMVFCFGSSSSYSGFDFPFHYRRLYTLIDALKHGVYPSFYVDFSNVESYGYFTKGFYSDIIMVPFAIVGIFSNVYFAYDLMIFTMTVLCGIIMYYAVNVIYRNTYTASISSILYTFAVYRLYDIYQRGALAEALSFTFLPLVFLGLYYVLIGNYRKWYILAIGYSLLIYTHTIASVLMFVVLLILLVIYIKRIINEPERLLYLLLAGVVTVLLTAYYILPMLEQLSSNSFYLDSRNPGGGAGYGKVGFDYIFWGFLSGVAYPAHELWSGVGIILTLCLCFRFFIRGQKTKLLRSADILAIMGLLFILSTSRIFPWGRFPFSLLSFIQYPWRLYEFVSLFFAIAGAYYISLVFVKSKQRTLVMSFIIIATMFTIYMHSENYKSLDPDGGKPMAVRQSLVEPDYEKGYNLIGREYLPSKLIDISYIHDRKERVDHRNSDTRISELRREYNETLFKVALSKSDTLELPLLYYLGYSVTLDKEKLHINQSDMGLIEVVAPRSGDIKAYYAGTTLQKNSFYISLLSSIALGIYIFLRRRQRTDETKFAR